MRKKTFGLIGVLVLITVLAACKAALGTPTLGNKPKVLKPGEILVKVSVADENFPSYRTVVPGEWDDAKKATLHYQICKYDNTQPNNIGTVLSGSASLDWDTLQKDYYMEFPDGQHDLIMVGRKYATPGSPLATDKIALISEKTTITLPGANLLNFVLRPFRKNTGEATAAPQGTVDIKFSFLDPTGTGYQNIDRVTAELKVLGAVGTAVPIEDVTASITDESGTGTTKRIRQFNYTKTDAVVPGVYEFIVKLYKGVDEFATASDIVIVDPANTSAKSIRIDTELDVPPAAPANLAVTYTRPGDGDTHYEAVFTWDDKSYNEEKFVLTITSPDGGSVTAVTPADLNEVPKNTREATVKLDLAKKYTATIKAVNKFGESTATAFADLKTGNFIHLARITYTLEQGEVISDPNDEAHTIKATSGDTAIGYYSQQIAGQPVMLPGEIGLPMVFRPADLDNSTTPPQYTNYKLKGWTGTGVAANQREIASTEYGNLTLTAVWEAEVSTGTTFPTYKDYCFIEGQNHYIEADTASPKAITAKVNPESDYAIAESKWYVDGTAISTGVVNTSTGSPQTSVLTKQFDAGLHRVWVIIKLTKAGAMDKYVSAYCYVKAQ